jgi:hypothetical protein
MNLKYNDLCPCGSGDIYGRCHNPKRDSTDHNYWRGPGYPQHIYLGHDERFNGVEYEKNGEISLLRGQDKVPIGRYRTIPPPIFNTIVKVNSLNISITGNEMIFTGEIEARAREIHNLLVLISHVNPNTATVQATVSGSPAKYEQGSWLLLLNREQGPLTPSIPPDWYRYFVGTGTLVEFPSTSQLRFKISQSLSPLACFALSLPYQRVEMCRPIINSPYAFSSASIQIERESIYWDLILHSSLFDDIKSRRVNPHNFPYFGGNSNSEPPPYDKLTRTVFNGPQKIHLGVFVPELNPTVGELGIRLDSIIRALVEVGNFQFVDQEDAPLEAEFRDQVLTALKGVGLFAEAEPTRRSGHIDILLRRGKSEGIVEFKLWGHHRYKDVVAQLLEYTTPWTTDLAIVMINNRKGSILDKHVINTAASPGFLSFELIEKEKSIIQRLVSRHFLPDWENPIYIQHYVINLYLLN